VSSERKEEQYKASNQILCPRNTHYCTSPDHHGNLHTYLYHLITKSLSVIKTVRQYQLSIGLKLNRTSAQKTASSA